MSEENITNKQALIRYVNRQQMSWRAVDVERLVSEDHPARAIWTMVGRLDLSSFYRAIESSVEEGGRPAFDPQLLISLWVYAYSQGIGSAREVARRCEYDPGGPDQEKLVDVRGFEPLTPCLQCEKTNSILLVRLALLCVVVPGFRPDLAGLFS